MCWEMVRDWLNRKELCITCIVTIWIFIIRYVGSNGSNILVVPRVNIELDEQVVEHVSCFAHLGQTITEDGN